MAQKMCLGSLITQQDTAAVQGLSAKSREGQDNNRSTRANQANLSTNQEKCESK